MARRAERIKSAEELASEREFSRRRNLPWVEVRYMHTARMTDTVLSLRGKELGSRTSTTKWGHESSVHYFLPRLEEGEIIE